MQLNLDDTGGAKELALHRISVAKEDLSVAEMNFESGHYRASNNRAYYAIFRAISACLALNFKSYGSMIGQVVSNGVDTISNALLGGQYEYVEGVYYGGTKDEKSTAYLKEVFQKTLDSEYENIVHIDIHSGYGPRYNMVIFNSVYETMTEKETVEMFGYDNVISHDSEDFYPTTGDTTDYYYRLKEHMGTETDLFSTCFEFGTIGNGFLDSVISMKYTIEENQNHWYPSANKITNEIIKERYQELFYPTEKNGEKRR